jgi:hypothetical protein
MGWCEIWCGLLLVYLTSLVSEAAPMTSLSSLLDQDVTGRIHTLQSSHHGNILTSLSSTNRLSLLGMAIARVKSRQLMDKVLDHSPSGMDGFPESLDRIPENYVADNAETDPLKAYLEETDSSIEPISKRYWRPKCSLNSITARTLRNFLRTGRLCGRRVANFRWALTGR